MFADTGHYAFGDQHMRTQSFGYHRGHMTNAAPVVFHCQMLEVLLDGGDGDDAGFQFTGLHPLPEFAAGELA